MGTKNISGEHFMLHKPGTPMVWADLEKTELPGPVFGKQRMQKEVAML